MKSHYIPAWFMFCAAGCCLGNGIAGGNYLNLAPLFYIASALFFIADTLDAKND